MRASPAVREPTSLAAILAGVACLLVAMASVREDELLLALARRNGRIISREDVYDEVWGSQTRKGDRSVDVYVHKLRDKLEAALPDWRYIHTHLGFGYRLAAEPVPRTAREPITGRSPNLHSTATDR